MGLGASSGAPQLSRTPHSICFIVCLDLRPQPLGGLHMAQFCQYLLSQHSIPNALSVLSRTVYREVGPPATLRSWSWTSARGQMEQASPEEMGLTADPAEGWSPGGGLQAMPSC